MKNGTIVIKIGGNDMDDPAFVQGIAQSVAANKNSGTAVLIHGGGRAISEMLQAMKINPQYKNGQRVTDAATLEIAEMVLSGKINKRLVLALLNAGVEAVGLSGVDRQLLQVEPWGADMDLVGRIIHVRTELLEAFRLESVVPVISPISVGPGGRYNVNADHAAGRVAGALQAEKAVFISNVPGVLIDGKLAKKISKTEAKALIEDGIIFGGMIPKVNAALDALHYGAKNAVITNLAGFQQNTGTRISN